MPAGPLSSEANKLPQDQELLRECLAVSGFLAVAADDKYFEVKRGRLSPLYLSMKALWKRPDLVASIDEHLLAINSDRPWDVVVGVAFGGIPHAVTLARQLRAPLVLWRGNQGDGRQLAGDVPTSAQSALVVEDVLATGSSAEPSVAVLRSLVPVIRLTAVFTYGLDDLITATRSIDVSTLFQVDRLVDLLEIDTHGQLTVRYAEFRNRLKAEVLAARGAS